MANSVLPTVANGHSVTISTFSADWTYSDHVTVPTGMRFKIKEIIFMPGAAGEYIVVKRDTDTGQIISALSSIDGSYMKDTFTVPEYNPMLDVSACSVASGTARVLIRYEIV